MNDKQRAKWKQTRARGMWRFILLNGILLFGSALIISTSIFDYFFSYNGLRLQDLYIKAPIYFISGLVFGLIVWFYGEYQYQKNSSNTQS